MWEHLIAPGITLLLAALGVAVMWGVVKQKVESQARAIEEMREECEAHRETCGDQMCIKIEELKVLVKEEARERRKDRESYTEEIIDFKKEVNETFRDMALFTGRVDEAIDTIKKRLGVQPIQA